MYISLDPSKKRRLQDLVGDAKEAAEGAAEAAQGAVEGAVKTATDQAAGAVEKAAEGAYFWGICNCYLINK